MTRLLIVRHGQSEANKSCIFAGHTDAPLSELGRMQAERTAEYIVNTYRVDKVYASDLKRAYDTGKAVADRLCIGMETHKKLREIYAGDWEGKTFDELCREYPEEYGLWKRDIGLARCTGGESLSEVQQRALFIVRDIVFHNEGKTIVIATHATVVRSLQCYVMGVPLSEMKNIPYVSNASVTVIDVDKRGIFSLVEAGHDMHLNELKSSLPANV